MSNFQSVLDYFGVYSQGELLQFIKDNPDDPKVVELNEVLNETSRSDADEG